MSAVGALLHQLTEPDQLLWPLAIVGVALVVTLVAVWYLTTS